MCLLPPKIFTSILLLCLGGSNSIAAALTCSNTDKLTAGESGAKVVFLSFDDGPTVGTKEVLDTLKSRGVRASFYLVGANFEPLLEGELQVKRNIELLHRIVRERHHIGSHSYNHMPPSCDYTTGQWDLFNFQQGARAAARELECGPASQCSMLGVLFLHGLGQ